MINQVGYNEFEVYCDCGLPHGKCGVYTSYGNDFYELIWNLKNDKDWIIKKENGEWKHYFNHKKYMEENIGKKVIPLVDKYEQENTKDWGELEIVGIKSENKGLYYVKYKNGELVLPCEDERYFEIKN